VGREGEGQQRRLPVVPNVGLAAREKESKRKKKTRNERGAKRRKGGEPGRGGGKRFGNEEWKPGGTIRVGEGGKSGLREGAGYHLSTVRERNQRDEKGEGEHGTERWDGRRIAGKKDRGKRREKGQISKAKWGGVKENFWTKR